MKFFNKFKWHTWQSPDTGYWYVRKMSLFLLFPHYVYHSGNYTWRTRRYVVLYCRMKYEGTAIDRLRALNPVI